jgi:hypothetical protein
MPLTWGGRGSNPRRSRRVAVCFRCLEAAIGRRFVPADFKPGVPANSAEYHGLELRARMGLT